MRPWYTTLTVYVVILVVTCAQQAPQHDLLDRNTSRTKGGGQSKSRNTKISDAVTSEKKIRPTLESIPTKKSKNISKYTSIRTDVEKIGKIARTALARSRNRQKNFSRLLTHNVLTGTGGGGNSEMLLRLDWDKSGPQLVTQNAALHSARKLGQPKQRSKEVAASPHRSQTKKYFQIRSRNKKQKQRNATSDNKTRLKQHLDVMLSDESDNTVHFSHCPSSVTCACIRTKEDIKVSCAGGTFPTLNSGDVINRLNLAYSDLRSIPDFAFSNTKVMNLELQGNMLESRLGSKCFFGLGKCLKSINLSWNRLSRLPPLVFRNLVQLKNLSLAENHLGRMQSSVFQDLLSLEYLSLSGNQLIELPQDLFKSQGNLLYLDLGYCAIERLAWTTFIGLAQLKSLDLRGNRLKTIEPYTFQDLSSLQFLRLDHNPLKRIYSKSLRGLKQLRVLDLAEAWLEDIESNSFVDLKSLERLNLADNRLKHLKVGCILLPRLRQLHLDGNKIDQIPPEVAYLHSLKVLDVSYNKIKSIDVCLLRGLDQLESINIRENPLHCDCSIFWLRRTREQMMKKWRDKRLPMPFLASRCHSPPSLADVSVTGWLDMACFGSSHRCQAF